MLAILEQKLKLLHAFAVNMCIDHLLYYKSIMLYSDYNSNKICQKISSSKNLYLSTICRTMYCKHTTLFDPLLI